MATTTTTTNARCLCSSPSHLPTLTDIRCKLAGESYSFALRAELQYRNADNLMRHWKELNDAISSSAASYADGTRPERTSDVEEDTFPTLSPEAQADRDTEYLPVLLHFTCPEGQAWTVEAAATRRHAEEIQDRIWSASVDDSWLVVPLQPMLDLGMGSPVPVFDVEELNEEDGVEADEDDEVDSYVHGRPVVLYHDLAERDDFDLDYETAVNWDDVPCPSHEGYLVDVTRPHQETTCCICLMDMRGDGVGDGEEEGEGDERMVVAGMGVCEHVFHRECIGMWLRQHNTCPLCRRIVAA